MNISGLFGALIPIFFVLALGYLAGKRNTFDADQSAGFSKLALTFALPASLVRQHDRHSEGAPAAARWSCSRIDSCPRGPVRRRMAASAARENAQWDALHYLLSMRLRSQPQPYQSSALRFWNHY